MVLIKDIADFKIEIKLAKHNSHGWCDVVYYHNGIEIECENRGKKYKWENDSKQAGVCFICDYCCKRVHPSTKLRKINTK